MDRRCVVCVSVLLCSLLVLAFAEDDTYKPKRREKPPDDGSWKKKDIRDYNDMDLERLYEQWEEDEDELPVDELPPWEKDPPPIDMSKVNLKNPDSILTAGKKHRNLMMFATVVGKPSEKETEKITAIWQTGLFNANIDITRYVIEPGKILINMQDGSNAVQIRDFLTSLDDCWDVTIEGKVYDGKGKKSAQIVKPLTKEQAKKEKKNDDDKRKTEL